MNVIFSASENPTEDGEFVTRTGKIFQAGNYPSKKFSLDAAEMEAVCREFQPVTLHAEGDRPSAKVNVGHKPTLFDLGELGLVAKIWNNGTDLFADVKIDKDIDAYFQKHGIEAKVSAEWDIDTKKLIGLSLEHNPYFKDAALYAAFSKDPADFARSAVARMHDEAVYGGAECGGKSLFRAVAEFMTPAELQTMQAVHDTCKGESSSHCNAMASRSAMYSADPGKSPTTNPDERPLPGGRGATTVPTTEKKPNKLALFFAALSGKTTEEVDTAMKTAEIDHAMFSEDRSDLDGKIAKFAADKREFDAKAWAEKVISTEQKAMPCERPAMIAAYSQFAEDDDANPKTVTFSDNAGKEISSSRVELLRALFDTRAAHSMFSEALKDEAVVAMLNKMETAKFADEKKTTDERKAELLGQSALGKQVLASRK